MKKQTIMQKLILISAIGVSLFASKINAESYIANDWDVYKNRTKEEIIEQYNKTKETGSYVNGKTETYYKVKPNTTPVYNEGELTADTHKAMTAMANYYRYLAGVSPLTGVSTHRKDLQAGALVRIKIENFAHILNDSQRPEGMSDSLWDIAKFPSHNIIAWGYTPTESITGWLDEGYNLETKQWDTTGHRRAILDAKNSLLQFGYVAPTAMGHIVETKNTSDLAYAAFPVPGYMPTNILNDETSVWNVILNTSKLNYQDASKITVRVTDLNTKKSYDCTAKDNTLNVAGDEIQFVQPSVEGLQYKDNTSYKVEILGLNEVSKAKDATTTAAKVEYTVNFFDVTKETNQKEPAKSEETNQDKPTNTENKENDSTVLTPENNQNKDKTEEQTKPTTSQPVQNTVSQVTEPNPATGDNITLTIALFILATLGSIVTFKKLLKN